MKRVLLAIDLSYQMYRASAAHPELTSVRGQYTGGVYGFLQSLGAAVRETEATHLVACIDTKPYWRSRDYPEYKMIRKKAADPDLRERYDETVPLMLDLLRVTGTPTWSVKGAESDDLIGQCLRYRHRFDRIFAMAKDSDLFQLLVHDNFAVYKDAKNIITAASLLADTGLTPAEYSLATALSGTHNDIEGIAGCGAILSRRAVKEPMLMRKYRAKHADLIDRNIGLIKLPHAELPRSTPIPVRTERFSERALYRWCAKLDIDCTFAMVSAFDQTNN